MSRLQLALRVGDLESSIAFYQKLLRVVPAKRRPDYANFVIEEPSFKLVLLPGEPGQRTVLDHLGIEVDETEEVTAAAERFDAIGMDKEVEANTACCYALQDKVWVHGPGGEPWEVYAVVAEADTLGKSSEIAAGHGGHLSWPDSPFAAICRPLIFGMPARPLLLAGIGSPSDGS